MDSTFKNVIDSLELEGVQSALVGHRDTTFKLLPCGFEVKDGVDDVGGVSLKRCDAKTFEHKVMDIVWWLSHVGLGGGGRHEAEAKTIQRERVIMEGMMGDMVEPIPIHLFMYDHEKEKEIRRKRVEIRLCG
jgi:hypothetical protein